MAASSKYLQLSSSVLMEYQYADQSNLPAHERQTSAANFWKMANGYTGVDYIMNDDNSESLTGNVRDRSAVLIDQTVGRYSYMNIDGINVYNDVDPELTDTINLPNNPTVSDNVVYDKVKLHFTQGFNFEQNEGLILEISIETAQSQKLILTSQAFIEEDVHAQLNSAPFLFGGKSYTSYIEFEIPAPFNLIEDHRIKYVQGGDANTAAYLISPVGYNTTTPINVKFGFIDEVSVVNGNTFFNSYYQQDVVLSKTDQFSSITASVAEAGDGDYYELQPLSNGQNIDNFIIGLNNSGGDYIILHDIAVFEQLPSGSFVKTQDMQIAQIDEFDRPITFRPVVINGAVAVSYRIDYVARLYNRLDNTQIWKVASMTNLDTKKYAKELNKLQIGSNPVIANVYNDVIQKTLNLTNLSTEDISLVKTTGYTKYVTSFIDTSNIHLNAGVVYKRVVNGETKYVSNNSGISEDDIAVFGQEELNISINNTTSYYKFIVYNDDREGQKTQMDLDGIGKLKLQFYDQGNKILDIDELDNSGANRSKGEAIFKISSTNANQLMNKANSPIYIVAQPEGGGEITQLYAASFTGPGAQQRTDRLSAAVQKYKSLHGYKSKKLSEAENIIIAKRKHENKLATYIKKVQETVVTYQQRIAELEKLVPNLDSKPEINSPTAPSLDPVENYETEQDLKKFIRKN